MYYKIIIIKFDFSWCQICSTVKFTAAILIVVAAIFNVAAAFLQLVAFAALQPPYIVISGRPRVCVRECIKFCKIPKNGCVC